MLYEVITGEAVLNRTWRPFLSVVGAGGLPPIKDAGNVLLAGLCAICCGLILGGKVCTRHAIRIGVALVTGAASGIGLARNNFV